MEKINIIATVGLIFGWELGTVSSNTAYYIFIPWVFAKATTHKPGLLRISKLLLGSGCGHPHSQWRGFVTNKQSLENVKKT